MEPLEINIYLSMLGCVSTLMKVFCTQRYTREWREEGKNADDVTGLSKLMLDNGQQY